MESERIAWPTQLADLRVTIVSSFRERGPSSFSIMKLDLKRAPTSLLVASTNLFLCGVSLSLGFTSYADWAVVLFMVFIPTLIAVTLVFFVRDMSKRTMRR